jgi:hypothetical protein
MQSSIRIPDPITHHPPVHVPAVSAVWGWRWGIVTAVAAALALGLGMITWWLFLKPESHATPVGRFGVALTDPWRAYATQPGNRAYLGDPVWAGTFEGRADCVAFEFYLACHDPQATVRGTLDEYDLVDLGRRALPAELMPRPSRPHPHLRAYFDHLERAGIAWRYWFGVPLSDPFCVSGGAGSPAECVQFFTRQVLRWYEHSTDPDSVRLSPLGVQLPRPR